MLTISGYHIIGLLAKGGMAKVYLARDLKKQRKVAIKVYQPKLGSMESAGTDVRKTFLEESRILADLNHINIVTIYEKGTLDDGRLYLVMEYIDSGDLRQRMSDITGELMAIGTLIELAYILHFVHNRGIIHCDVKPANILFRRDDSLVLTDFGIAKHFHDPSCQEKTDTICVSPDYASPEQVRGLPFDLRTDIYSAGLVFLEMLIGKNPYRGRTVQETLKNHLRAKPPQLNDHLQHYQPLINSMLAKSPNDRFNSMNECVDHINNLLIDMADDPIPAMDIPLLIEADDIAFDEFEQLGSEFRTGFETTVLRAVGFN